MELFVAQVVEEQSRSLAVDWDDLSLHSVERDELEWACELLDFETNTAKPVDS